MKRRILSKSAILAMREGGLKGSHSGRNVVPTTSIMWEQPDMIITQVQAMMFGFTVYRTGKPCKYKHTGWRYTYNNLCIECNRERKRKFPDNARGTSKIPFHKLK
jgi:hypothetical protein